MYSCCMVRSLSEKFVEEMRLYIEGLLYAQSIPFLQRRKTMFVIHLHKMLSL